MTNLRRSTLAMAMMGVFLAPATVANEIAGKTLSLEEVLVTAEKREQTLQETPISILAFSAEKLARFGVTDLGDVSGLAPNVEITPFPVSRSSLVVFMRGVGNNDSQSTQDPAVGIYIDGIYMARSIGLSSDVADLERIEVLRGPQGTLYGRNTTGGAINLITAKPSEEAGLSQTVSRGNRGYWKTLTKIESGQRGDVAAKLTYLRSAHDGWVNNTGPGRNFGAEDKSAGRLALRWDISDVMSIDYAYDFSEIDGPQHFYQPVSGVSPNPAAPASNSRNSSGQWFGGTEPTNTEISGHSLIFTLDTSVGVFKSITAYRELNETSVQDYDAGTPGFRVSVDIDQEQVSQELQLVGGYKTDINYVAGIYYFRETGNEIEEDTYGGFPLENRQIISESEAQAIYGQLTWSPSAMNHRLDITLGGRYTMDDRSANKSSITFVNGPQSGSESWSNFNPSLMVDYAWTETLSSYAKVVSAYKSGGFNVRSTEAGFQPPFDEENILSYELGLKSTWLDRRISFNAAAFHAEYTDMQLQQITNNFTIFLTDVFNVGEAEVDGFEFDFMAVLVDGLTLQASYGYTYADFIEYIDQRPSEPTFGQDVSDRAVMPYAPKQSFTIGLDYEASINFGLLQASVDYSWRDERYGTAFNDDLEGFFLDDYGVVNARLAVTDISIGKANVEVSAWGRNLDSEEYKVHSISLGTYRSAFFGEPKSYGVDVTLRF
ncbi:Pesticin receptor [Zhongshania aliphaticivorans]|uniref:Pesticin receptor n=1 Tax=Zhongshania aliphaticivorans TaxID=1470434 RepID=A0A5S9NDQ5_9GAMM|nr:TonB-dependent receptor [Zhongshania aliphaticivorans]CAA0087577.1 Pesticin receptor [Zhongshania aliphaticivorans]CAA0115135.1 Pesticin receptor [Zhongshania aliphaticivorans]CAA0119990.1 Pesticin receptor [Zhongshania aliphaticivorans]